MNHDFMKIGFQFAAGTIGAIALWMAATFAVGLAFEAVGLRALDDTDAADGTRSGVRLRTDYGTGCQYLETSGGGVTPRLDRDGKHFCADERG